MAAANSLINDALSGIRGVGAVRIGLESFLAECYVHQKLSPETKIWTIESAKRSNLHPYRSYDRYQLLPIVFLCPLSSKIFA